ncbi:ser/Thr protein phosphatase family protein [Durotheca rogersii]|uniref:ser/Thr protein phosphatase family protein n=1 Tax=Durotheca rogersii TaxID=419775 RepID=UPI00221E705C|nr:ser/Thr protein phosphatase family protein [Durotheca rogersii]KAI5863936.1 ser/Thr protein phosphatase family protein [Durotheca rogersii]
MMQTSGVESFVKTKILILSDTHGMSLAGKIPSQPADVAIHCGDLTEESKLDEFRATLELLRAIKAPLKLVIAGNHDFTLDTLSFRKKVEEARPRLEPELVAKFYGQYEEARCLLLDAKKDGIYLLDEGIHRIGLQNGATLAIYASPYTPSLGDWGFQYRPCEGHTFSIKEGTDIMITHGPPRGILDRTNSRERAGCPDLFTAAAKVKPRIHCFGHIHEGWGARMVTWRETLSEKPSHLTDIDNSRSFVIEQLNTLQRGKFDTPEDAKRKEEKVRKYAEQKFCGASYCYGDRTVPEAGKQTLFVNASVKGDEDMPIQLPWLVELELPKVATRKRVNTPETIL